MLVHLSPDCYLKAGSPELVAVEFPAFNVRLAMGAELKLGRPHPNKCYSIAYAAGERRMKAGFFVDVPDGLESLTTQTRWSFGGYGVVFEVEHHFVDHDFDAASDDALLWNECKEREWARRWPAHLEGKWPLEIKQTLHPETNPSPIQRRSTWLPSIERERLTAPVYGVDRMPDASFVFSLR